MYARIIDESNPRYRGPLPKPRGLLPVPPEIAEEICRDQAANQPNYTDEYAKLTRDDWTLTYYYEGDTVACRTTHEGVEVLAVGWDEVSRFLEETPPDALAQIPVEPLLIASANAIRLLRGSLWNTSIRSSSASAVRTFPEGSPRKTLPRRYF